MTHRSRSRDSLRASRALSALGLWACVLAVHGCVPVEPEPLVDKDGKPIPLPEFGDRWLQLRAVHPPPGPVELRPTFALTFYDYLDPTTFLSFNFASMHSGGLQTNGRAWYRMTDKTVVWQPNGALEADLGYRLKLTPGLRSATGAPLLPEGARTILSSAQNYLPTRDLPAPEEPDPEEPKLPAQDALTQPLPKARWADVEPIIAARCASCHADPGWSLNPLTYDSLIGQRSEQVDLFLVRPGDPARSYLMRKLLWDYPDLKFEPQPPPWSQGARQLPREELLLIEGWIAHGARR